MPGLFYKAGGAWKQVNNSRNTPPYSWYKTGGVWRPYRGIFYKTSDAYKEVYVEQADNYLVSGTNAVLGASNTALTWTAPVSTSVDNVRIQRGLNTKPVTYTDGTNVTTVPRATTSHNDTGVTNLSPLGTYWYAWFTHISTDGPTVWQGPVYNSVVVSDITPPGAPNITYAQAHSGTARVNFTNPYDSDFNYTEVRYATDHYPSKSSGTHVGNYYTAGQSHSISLQGPGWWGNVGYHNGEASGNYWHRSGNSHYYFSLFAQDLRGNVAGAANTNVYFLRSPITTYRTSNDSWGSAYGWETSYHRIRQANYGSSNEYRGFWYYGGARPWGEIGGRQASGFVWMCRTTGSNGSNVNTGIRLYGHADTSQAGNGLGDYYGDLSGPGISFDNPRYCAMPGGLVSALTTGRWLGFACYGDQDSQCYIGGDDYGGNDGQVDMYHFDYA